MIAYNENVKDFWQLKNKILTLLTTRINTTDYCLDIINNTVKNDNHEINCIINTNLFYFNRIRILLETMETNNTYLSECFYNRKLIENAQTSNSN